MRDRLLPLGLILILAALLTSVLYDFTRQSIVTPLLYLFWVGRLLFQSIPQIGIWGIFFIIALLIAGRSLVKKRPRRRKIRRVPTARQERIETWVKLIERANRETYYKWQLAQNLRKLTLETLAHDERLTPKEIQQHLTAGKLDIPPEIEAYLQASLTSFSHFSWSKPRSRLKRPPSPLDLDPERVVRFLEDKLR